MQSTVVSSECLIRNANNDVTRCFCWDAPDRQILRWLLCKSSQNAKHKEYSYVSQQPFSNNMSAYVAQQSEREHFDKTYAKSVLGCMKLMATLWSKRVHKVFRHKMLITFRTERLTTTADQLSSSVLAKLYADRVWRTPFLHHVFVVKKHRRNRIKWMSFMFTL